MNYPATNADIMTEEATIHIRIPNSHSLDATTAAQEEEEEVIHVSESGRHTDSHREEGEGEDVRPAKRRKEAHVRSRVSRACDRCKARKTRCSGKYPCTFCAQLDVECRFTAAYRRGRLPSIELETDDSLLHQTAIAVNPHHALPHVANRQSGTAADLRNNEAVEDTRSNEEGLPIPSPISIEQHQPAHTVQTGLAPQLAGLQPHETGSALHSSRNSPEPSQSDQQGHYVGPASGASFLLRLQRKLLHQQSSLPSECSIFTFGDRPLPDFDASFFILPPKAEAECLLARYFDFASATHRFLHRPTVEGWLQELYETNGAMWEKPTAQSRTALLFMVFAHANTYPRNRNGNNEANDSARFFSAAEHQLSAERGEIRITSVQARLAQCFYLLAQSRLNHCWSLFGTTSHLVLALGLHRKRRIDISHGVDYIDLECRKRTFWCAYNLDTYLSAVLGRPRTFHDEDIDQEMPTCINDSELLSHQIHPSPTKAQSIMSGSVAHIKLTRIIANILRELYGIKTPPSAERFRLASKYNNELNSWRNDLPYVFNTDDLDYSLFLPLFLRQRNVLNFAFWHAQILVHRPFLLSNFTSLNNYKTYRYRLKSNPELDKCVQQCINAAMSIANTVDELTTTGQIYSTFWFTHYFAFCAVVVLYVYIIQERYSPPERYLPQFQAATKCQAQISTIATKGSMTERYGVVLQELRLELLRHNQFLAAQDGTASALLIQELIAEQGQSAIGLSHVIQQDNRAPHLLVDGIPDVGPFQQPQTDGFPGGSPSSSISQLVGWGQFDSLVTGGIGGFDSILSDGIGGTWDMNLAGNIGSLT